MLLHPRLPAVLRIHPRIRGKPARNRGNIPITVPETVFHKIGTPLYFCDNFFKC